MKLETNREPCAAKCTQEISQARKLGCVRGVNLRLSQPEATIAHRKDAIFRKAFGLRVAGGWGQGSRTRRRGDVSCNFIKETELLGKKKEKNL